MVSPDVNTIFLTIEVEGVQEAHFARGYAGFVTAVGYLSMRFLYSSSIFSVIAVSIKPGEIQFTVIFFFAYSKDKLFDIDAIPPFDAE